MYKSEKLICQQFVNLYTESQLSNDSKTALFSCKISAVELQKNIMAETWKRNQNLKEAQKLDLKDEAFRRIHEEQTSFA